MGRLLHSTPAMADKPTKWSDPSRFNLGKFKTQMCSHWQIGKCLRGERCTFAHGEHDIREPGTVDLPGDLWDLRRRQQLTGEIERRRPKSDAVVNCISSQGSSSPKEDRCSHSPGHKRSHSLDRGRRPSPGRRRRSRSPVSLRSSDSSEASEQVALEAMSSGIVFPSNEEAKETPPKADQPKSPPPWKAAPSAPQEVLKSKCPMPACPPPAAPKAMLAPRPELKPKDLSSAWKDGPPKLLAQASPKLGGSQRPRQEIERATPPTLITTMGFSKTFAVFLGGAEHAYTGQWMRENNIQRVVRCTPYHFGHYPKRDVREWEITVEWKDVGQDDCTRWRYFQWLHKEFGSLSAEYGPILFYCKRGRHRSSAVLAMWLLWCWQPVEEPQAIMAELKALRDEVDFFVQDGKYPALAKIVVQWYQFLKSPMDAGDRLLQTSTCMAHAEHDASLRHCVGGPRASTLSSVAPWFGHTPSPGLLSDSGTYENRVAGSGARGDHPCALQGAS